MREYMFSHGDRALEQILRMYVFFHGARALGKRVRNSCFPRRMRLGYNDIKMCFVQRARALDIFYPSGTPHKGLPQGAPLEALLGAPLGDSLRGSLRGIPWIFFIP